MSEKEKPQCQCTSIGIAEDMCGPLPLECPVHPRLQPPPIDDQPTYEIVYYPLD